ncbi:OmpA-like domain-containing protein [uncultured Gammaproteobacteria bacterium]
MSNAENAAMAVSRAMTAFVAVVVIGVAGCGSAWADCAFRASALEAQQVDNGPELRALFERAAADPGCDAAFRIWLGKAVARVTEKRVYQAVQTGQSIEPFADELERALRYAKSWRILAWLGDIARDRKNYSDAGTRYQDSLAAINDEAATPSAPPREVIEQIFRRAEQARLLSASYIPAPRTRGVPQGLGAASVRGFVPQRVAVPIEFGYDSTDFTDKGALAVADLLGLLRQQNMPSITLIGHTDPAGSDDYNMKLSLNRAQAVREYLLANGYSGPIAVEGRGKREPLAVDDQARYSSNELHKMYRRVELQR